MVYGIGATIVHLYIFSVIIWKGYHLKVFVIIVLWNEGSVITFSTNYRPQRRKGTCTTALLVHSCKICIKTLWC